MRNQIRSAVVLWCWTFRACAFLPGCLAKDASPTPPEHLTPDFRNSSLANYGNNVLGFNQSNYPEWSWDHVRTYVAVRRADEYSNDQIAALAKQDIVMLEKANGARTFGSVEEGSLQAARRIKAVNPKVKVLFYLNAMVHYGGYAANKEFKTEWAMYNRRRKVHMKWRKKFLSYDHTNLEFREWWIQRALNMTSHDEIDGIFIDGIIKTDYRRLPVRGRWRRHSTAYVATANELRERLPGGKLLIGNGLRAATRNRNGYQEHLEYLDGAYLEGWKVQKRLGPTLDLMSAALKRGRIVMLNAGPSHYNTRKYKQMRNLDERYEYLGRPEFVGFPLGYFLLIAEPHAHISYHVGVDANPRRRTVFDNTRFEAITRELGEPLSDFVKEGEDEYSREFEHLTVWVNIRTWEGNLTAKDGQDRDLKMLGNQWNFTLPKNSLPDEELHK